MFRIENYEISEHKGQDGILLIKDADKSSSSKVIF